MPGRLVVCQGQIGSRLCRYTVQMDLPERVSTDIVGKSQLGPIRPEMGVEPTAVLIQVQRDAEKLPRLRSSDMSARVLVAYAVSTGFTSRQAGAVASQIAEVSGLEVDVQPIGYVPSVE